MNIGDRIRNRRLELNMTQDELAKKLGYKTRGSVTKIESGYQNLTQPKIVAMAKALDTTPAYLMGWEDNMGVTTTNTGNHNTTTTTNYYSDCGSSAKEAIEFIDKDSALHRIMDLLLSHKKEFKRSDLEWLKQNIDYFMPEK
jgi:transcriptional regulator, XRE family